MKPKPRAPLSGGLDREIASEPDLRELPGEEGGQTLRIQCGGRSGTVHLTIPGKIRMMSHSAIVDAAPLRRRG
jgi:hypothetical protein